MAHLFRTVINNPKCLLATATPVGLGLYYCLRTEPEKVPGPYDHITDPEERYVLTKLLTVKDDPELARHYHIIKEEQRLGIR